MKRYLASMLVTFAGFAAAQPVDWPALPAAGFLVGRAAAPADVTDGRAVFVAGPTGSAVGKPLAIAIPQYAWFTHEGRKVPAIVIQAEEADGRAIIGARLLSGKLAAGLASDFQLLGTQAPR